MTSKYLVFPEITFDLSFNELNMDFFKKFIKNELPVKTLAQITFSQL